MNHYFEQHQLALKLSKTSLFNLKFLKVTEGPIYTHFNGQFVKALSPKQEISAKFIKEFGKQFGDHIFLERE